MAMLALSMLTGGSKKRELAGHMGSFSTLQSVVICIPCVHSLLALTSSVTCLNAKVVL